MMALGLSQYNGANNGGALDVDEKKQYFSSIGIAFDRLPWILAFI